MDDYKKYIYMRNPERYENIKTGDLSFQLAIKEKLQCKPFSYFIERVAPDMLQFYPLIDPPPFARGAVSFSLVPGVNFKISVIKDSKRAQPIALHRHVWSERAQSAGLILLC